MSQFSWEINVPNKEYLSLLEDLMRMVTIQITIQFLYFINNDNVSFFSADFVLLLIYVVLGVCVYWLVIKKLVIFK